MSSSNTPCAACKFLRQKCTQECDFAPYFPPDNPQQFVSVHRVFGASNVRKILKDLNAAQRDEAVKSLAYEAEARLRDPVYGCVGFISVLQQRLKQIQAELQNAKKELSQYLSPQAMQYFLANPNAFLMAQHNNLPPQGNPFSLFPNYPNNIPQPPPVFAGHGGGQLVIRDPEQQELLEAQQLAAAAREHQQQELMRFNSGFETLGSVAVGAGSGTGGFGSPVNVPAEVPPSLALGTFENVNPYQIQQGEHHHIPHHTHTPIEAQLLLSPQQQTQQSQQQPHQSGSEDGRSVGPSC